MRNLFPTPLSAPVISHLAFEAFVDKLVSKVNGLTKHVLNFEETFKLVRA